jgi:predicted acetyltransferase
VSVDGFQLLRPASGVRDSFLAAVSEFRAEGNDERIVADQAFDVDGADWQTPAGFELFVTALHADALEDPSRSAGKVPQTTLWWARGPEYAGRLDIRHRLTPALLEVGGHIGYAVRPSARRQGHATAMLRAALPIARALGLRSVLITCDADNVGSRRVITSNGGVLEDRRGVKLRFWVPTSPAAGP